MVNFHCCNRWEHLGWKNTRKFQSYGLSLDIWREGREIESNDKLLAYCFEEYYICGSFIMQSSGVQFDLRKFLFKEFLDISLNLGPSTVHWELADFFQYFVGSFTGANLLLQRQSNFARAELSNENRRELSVSPFKNQPYLFKRRKCNGV